MIEVTVKTLDSQNRAFTLEDDEITVQDFKKHIAEAVSVPVERQRLIYCGKVLRNEKKLNDYDVNGKVIHLVQVAPPEPGQRRNDGSQTQNNQNRGVYVLRNLRNARYRLARTQMHGNAMYVGAMSVPAEIVEGHALPVPQFTNASSNSRFILAIGMLHRANVLIERLEDPTPPNDNSEENQSDAQPPQQSQSEQQGSAVNNEGPTNRLPRHGLMAQILEDLMSTLDNLRPYIERYCALMFADEALPHGGGPGSVEESQRIVDGVSEGLHYIAHVCHALSDINIDMGQQPPRNLRSRPIIIQQSTILQPGVPIQAHFNVHGQNANNNNSNEENNDSASTTAQSELNEANAEENNQHQESESGAQQQPELQQEQTQTPFGTVFNLPNDIVLMEVSPESNFTIGSEQFQSGENNNNNNNNNGRISSAADLIRNIIQAVAGHIVPDGITTTTITTQNLPTPGGQRTSSSHDGNTNAGQSTQARSNVDTHPTTATRTRSTSRPQAHSLSVGISLGQGLTEFDRFLPCNSHHIRRPLTGTSNTTTSTTQRARTSQTSTTETQPSTQTATTSATTTNNTHSTNTTAPSSQADHYVWLVQQAIEESLQNYLETIHSTNSDTGTSNTTTTSQDARSNQVPTTETPPQSQTATTSATTINNTHSTNTTAPSSQANGFTFSLQQEQEETLRNHLAAMINNICDSDILRSSTGASNTTTISQDTQAGQTSTIETQPQTQTATTSATTSATTFSNIHSTDTTTPSSQANRFTFSLQQELEESPLNLLRTILTRIRDSPATAFSLLHASRLKWLLQQILEELNSQPQMDFSTNSNSTSNTITTPQAAQTGQASTTETQSQAQTVITPATTASNTHSTNATAPSSEANRLTWLVQKLLEEFMDNQLLIAFITNSNTGTTNVTTTSQGAQAGQATTTETQSQTQTATTLATTISNTHSTNTTAPSSQANCFTWLLQQILGESIDSQLQTTFSTNSNTGTSNTTTSTTQGDHTTQVSATKTQPQAQTATTPTTTNSNTHSTNTTVSPSRTNPCSRLLQQLLGEFMDSHPEIAFRNNSTTGTSSTTTPSQGAQAGQASTTETQSQAQAATTPTTTNSSTHSTNTTVSPSRTGPCTRLLQQLLGELMDSHPEIAFRNNSTTGTSSTTTTSQGAQAGQASTTETESQAQAVTTSSTTISHTHFTDTTTPSSQAWQRTLGEFMDSQPQATFNTNDIEALERYLTSDVVERDCDILVLSQVLRSSLADILVSFLPEISQSPVNEGNFFLNLIICVVMKEKLRNMTLLDVLRLHRGQWERISDQRVPLLIFLEDSFPRSSVEELPEQVVNRALSEMKRQLQSMFATAEVNNGRNGLRIDICATLEALLQRDIKHIVQLVLDKDISDMTFAQEVHNILRTSIKQFLAVIQHSIQGGLSKFAAMLVRFTNEGSEHRELLEWTWEFFISQNMTLPPDSEILPLLIYKDVPPSQPSDVPSDSTQQPCQVQSEVEPMETEVVEETNFENSLLDDSEEVPDTFPVFEALPSDWVPIIARDGVRQRRQLLTQGMTNGSVTTLSDAYLGTLPTKRRKLIEQQKSRLLVSPTPNHSAISASMERLVRESVNRAGIEEIEGAAVAVAVDPCVRRAFGQAIRDCLNPCRYETPDFPDSLRFPNATKYFADQDRPSK